MVARLSLLLCPLALLAACSPPTCADHVEWLESCGVAVVDGARCADPEFACWTACYQHIPCSDVPGVLLDDEPLPREVAECGAGCRLPFDCAAGEQLPYDSMICNGVRDCANGSDEEGCAP